MTSGKRMTQPRTILKLTGSERIDFLQGLITNDMEKLQSDPIYAALLTPQGKYLSDFFVLTDPTDAKAILIDTHADLAEALFKRLSFFRLRADVKIEESPLKVLRGTGDAPAGAMSDPRHPDLGWRLYGDEDGQDDSDFDAIRVKNCIPEAFSELVPDETYVLEAGFERLNGVDFKKGCYVGQEVTARMKHKTELRKGFVRVGLLGPVSPGTEILAEGRAAGRICTVSGKEAIAYLRLDRADRELSAGETIVLYPA